MNTTLYVIFLEEFFVGAILPNESAWETLRVNGVDRLPLYFYVSGGDVRNDDFARERAEANDPAAFGDFYRAILDRGRTFRRFDMELEAIDLLDDVLQKLKAAYFERMRAFDEDFDVGSDVPLRLCFAPGIESAQRERLRTYLGGQGFSLTDDADYLQAFLTSLQRKAIIQSKANLAVVESSFGDLRFDYVEWMDGPVRRESEILVGKGIDHRVANLARLLVEKAARKAHARILGDPPALEQEVKRFHRLAASEINKFEYDQLDLKIELSDFSSSRVIVDRREVDRMSSESFSFIKHRFETFISKYSNLGRTEKILLNGDLLASQEFIQFFQKTFGASKIVKPFDSFIELLSRGMAVNPPEEETVIMTVTVVTKPSRAVAHTAPGSARVVGPPDLPPIPGKGAARPGNAIAHTAAGSARVGPPDLPPIPGKGAARPGNAIAHTTAGSARVGPPDLPPIPGRGNTRPGNAVAHAAAGPARTGPPDLPPIPGRGNARPGGAVVPTVQPGLSSGVGQGPRSAGDTPPPPAAKTRTNGPSGPPPPPPRPPLPPRR